MKISVEFSDKELREIRRMTRVDKKGPAIRAIALEALKLYKRRAPTEPHAL
jgi:hypothetical protein